MVLDGTVFSVAVIALRVWNLVIVCRSSSNALPLTLGKQLMTEPRTSMYMAIWCVIRFC